MTGFVLPGGPLVVAAIGAHPDDIEIGCGATLLMLGRRPDVDIRSLILTGTPERVQEAILGAKAFGVTEDPRFARMTDARLPSHWDEVKNELHAFRDEIPQPDVVFAPRPDDAHQDHALIGSLVATVWRGPVILQYEIPKWDGDLGRPNVYVPLTDEIANRKVELLNACFPSQHGRGWWDDEFFLSLMRLRGAETQVRYAEAFTTAKLTWGIS